MKPLHDRPGSLKNARPQAHVTPRAAQGAVACNTPSDGRVSFLSGPVTSQGRAGCASRSPNPQHFSPEIHHAP